MRVFVAGATGAVGRLLVPMLVAAGHEVTGISRTQAGTERIKGLGATGVQVDAPTPGRSAARSARRHRRR